MPMRWYGDFAKRYVKGTVAERIEMAGRILRDEARQQLNTSQPVAGTGTRRRGLDPSAPGQPLKKVTGHLQRNTQMEFDRRSLTARVGTNVLYGKYWELTNKGRRPWLTISIKKARRGLRKVLKRGR